MKKILLAAIVLMVFAAGCVSPPTAGIVIPHNEPVLLEAEGELPGCTGKLEGKIIIIESKYCGACKEADIILKELEKEMKEDFIFLDISDEKDNKEMGRLGLKAKFTPTVVADCNVLIGAKTKEEYREAFE